MTAPQGLCFNLGKMIIKKRMDNMLLYISLIYCQGQIPGRSQHIRLFAPINIQIWLQGFVIFC